MNFSAPAARCARGTPSKLPVALPLVIMGVFYWLSSLPATPLPDDPALYAVFYWVPPSRGHGAGHSAHGCVPVARAIGACAIASAYGVSDEWHQSFVPGRYAQINIDEHG